MTASILQARRHPDRLSFLVWCDITKRGATVTTGTPITAATATTATVTGTSLTVNAFAGQIIQTASVWGYVMSNTTSVITVTGWFSVTTGLAGSTPAASTAFTVGPPDPNYIVSKSYPPGYDAGRTVVAINAIKAELTQMVTDQLAVAADLISGGSVLSIEGQAF